MPVILTQEQIEKIQKMRYEGASNDDIKKEVPLANDSLIGTYAPSELRGGKRRLAEYINSHPGVDFKDLDFRAFDVDPNRAAGQIRDLHRAGLLTFKEGRIALMKGDHHTAGNASEKGIYNLRLTPMGVRRVEASRLIEQVAAANKASTTHAAIASKVAEGQTEAFRLLPPDVLEQKAVELNPSIAELPTTVGGFPVEIAEPVETATLPEPLAVVDDVVAKAVEYPILNELRRKEARIQAANRLIDQALNLYDKADLTDEAIALLDHLKVTEVKFTPIERELMRLAEDQGI